MEQKRIKSLSAVHSILCKMLFWIIWHSYMDCGRCNPMREGVLPRFHFMFFGCKLFQCAFTSKYHPMTESNDQYEIQNFLYLGLFVIKQDTYWFDGINCDNILLHLTLIIVSIKENNWLSPFEWSLVMWTNKSTILHKASSTIYSIVSDTTLCVKLLISLISVVHCHYYPCAIPHLAARSHWGNIADILYVSV